MRNTGRPPARATPCGAAPSCSPAQLALQRELRRLHVPHNPALFGVHDFAAADYRALVRGWLACVPPEGALLACHPGCAEAPGDAIAASRPRETAYLDSGEFARDLCDAGIAAGQVW